MTTCACGRPYYPDSTGEGPCHFRCECGDLIDSDDMSLPSYFEMCEDCFTEHLESDKTTFTRFIELFRKAVVLNKRCDNKWSIDEYFSFLEEFNKKRGV